MAPRPEEDEDPTLTEELRAVMRPRAGKWLALLVLLAVLLGVLALMASRSVLAALWD
jgi:uncharacterized integral membrane protein